MCNGFRVISVGVRSGWGHKMGAVLWGMTLLGLCGCLEGLKGYDFRGGREGVVVRAAVGRVRVRGNTCKSVLVVVVM